ncbi:MAG: hypothetical protein M0R49_01580 [Limnochordia bacterium]|jgi:hypothetical protein|nr:hypothetical protein [Limnochordia bacterium]
MDHNLERLKFDLEEQLLRPGDVLYSHYKHLEAWQLNRNRIHRDKYLFEVAKELGTTTLPHWQR